MALADIIACIESDASAEAEVIVAQAREQAAALLAAAEHDAAASGAATLAGAQRAAESEASSLVAGARLEARDEAVRAKRDVLVETLSTVIEAIEALPGDRYAEFLGGLIGDNVRDGDTVALAAADQPVAAQIRRVVEQRAGAVTLEWAPGPAPLERGAAVTGQRTSLMLTPETVVEARRDELELTMAASLFAPEGA
ncbi:MAG: V-type ATP synthase subunit E family protein [Coriobacteriia bacterium]|nr:V-type ATP synthase subunit E family protein [Coriobacteriia bacterium]